MPYKNPLDHIKQSRAYYKAHRAQQCAKQRARSARNKKVLREAFLRRMAKPGALDKKRAADRAAYAKDPLRDKDYQLRKRYGITLDEYRGLIARQGGQCAVCLTIPVGVKQKTRTLHVDHDHATGRVRGLLCDSCNRGMGLLGDNPQTFLRAVDYLYRHADYRHSA